MPDATGATRPLPKPGEDSAVRFGNFTVSFLDRLSERMAGQRVLEVFAGNGLLAAELSRRGVSITATSLFAGHDGHEFGLYHPVLEMDARNAVIDLGPAHDILLMSWPTTSPAAYGAARLWGADKAILFIGEVTDTSRGHFGGCATDEFFEIITRRTPLSSYTPRNLLDQAMEVYLQPEFALTG